MRRRKKAEGSHNNSERWLLTYSDLITLLMIFFVVMYSMSNIDKQKYQQIAESLQETLGTIDASGKGKEEGNGSTISTNESDEETKIDLTDLKDKVDKYIKQKGLEDDIAVTSYEKGLVISFKDDILFNSGESILKQDYIENIKKLGELLKTVDHYVRVEGYTDNVKMSNEKFKSNWELSSARANEVLHFLVDNNYVSNEKISSVGYGEYRPIASNDTAEGRSKNRRVDILLIDKKYEFMK